MVSKVSGSQVSASACISNFFVSGFALASRVPVSVCMSKFFLPGFSPVSKVSVPPAPIPTLGSRSPLDHRGRLII